MTEVADHKKIWGHGYNKGLEDALKDSFRFGQGKYSAKEVMLCWKPNTDEVMLVNWPDHDRVSKGYWSTLACLTHFREMSFEQRKEFIFIEAMHLILRDNINPRILHKVLLDVREYRDGCADEILGDF